MIHPVEAQDDDPAPGDLRRRVMAASRGGDGDGGSDCRENKPPARRQREADSAPVAEAKRDASRQIASRGFREPRSP
jgi:hypothetical protein